MAVPRVARQPTLRTTGTCDARWPQATSWVRDGGVSRAMRCGMRARPTHAHARGRTETARASFSSTLGVFWDVDNVRWRGRGAESVALTAHRLARMAERLRPEDHLEEGQQTVFRAYGTSARVQLGTVFTLWGLVSTEGVWRECGQVTR